MTDMIERLRAFVVERGKLACGSGIVSACNNSALSLADLRALLAAPKGRAGGLAVPAPITETTMHPNDIIAALEWAAQQARIDDDELVRLNVYPALQELLAKARRESRK